MMLPAIASPSLTAPRAVSATTMSSTPGAITKKGQP